MDHLCVVMRHEFSNWQTGTAAENFAIHARTSDHDQEYCMSWFLNKLWRATTRECEKFSGHHVIPVSYAINRVRVYGY